MKNLKEVNTYNIDSNNEEIDLQYIFRILKRGKKLIFGIVLFSTVFSTAYSFSVKPKWSGSFNIVVKENSADSDPNLGGGFGIILNNLKPNDENETQKLILKSPLVLMPVFNYLENYYEERNIDTKELYFQKWVEDSLTIDFEDNTSVLKVQYISQDKDLVLEILELISSKYKDYSKRDALKQITKTIKYIEDQTKIMRSKSLKSMESYNKFSIKNGLGSIDGFVEIDNYSSSQRFNTINSQNADGQNIAANGFPNKFKANSLDSGAGIRFENQFSLLEKYEADFIDLSAKLKPNSSTLKDLSLKIYNLREALKRPNEILLEFRKLKDQAMRDEGILDDLENTLLVLQLNKIKTPDAWEMISIPTLDNNGRKVFPQKKQIVILGFIFSLMIGSIISLIKEKLSDKIFEINEYKENIKFKFLDTIYKNNSKLNLTIIKNFINIEDNFAVIKLSDDFFDQLTPNIEIFNDFKNIKIINLNNIEDLSKFKNIILITEKGLISKENLNQIEKYLLPYEKEIIGWFFVN